MGNNSIDSNKKYLFTTVDCIGNKVVLKATTFYEHILSKRPQMTVELIKDVVESPHVIVNDIDNVNKYNCYKFTKNPIVEKNNMVCTIVAIERKSEYYDIATSIPSRKVPSKQLRGDILYDSSKR